MIDVTPTDQQAAIADAVSQGETCVVDAAAGTGKTTTACMLTRPLRRKRVLYLVYNRAAKDDLAMRLTQASTLIEVKTTSALGYGAYRERYGHRMNFETAPYVPPAQAATLAGHPNSLTLGGPGEEKTISTAALGRLALAAVMRFAHSDSHELSSDHVPSGPRPDGSNGMPHGLTLPQTEALRQHVTSIAKKIWAQSLDVNSRQAFPQDYATKLLHLDGVRFPYASIVIDEAQDSNAVVEAIVKAQDCQVIAIGDPAQAINGWRGAIDIMGRFDGVRLPLTQSWRFGEEIAQEARKWLAHTGTGIDLIGNPAVHSRISPYPLPGAQVILCRTNSGCLDAVLAEMVTGRRVAVAGGARALKELAQGAQQLMSGRLADHPHLVGFRTWEEVEEYAEEAGGELRTLVRVIARRGISAVLRACAVLVPEDSNPDVLVSTVHKAKGLEWATVSIGDDFSEPVPVADPETGDPAPGLIAAEEAMLSYVATTRAKDVLYRGSLGFIDQYPPERNFE